MKENTKKKNNKKNNNNKELTPMQKVNKFLKSKLFGFILSVINIVVTLVFLSFLLYVNMLPAKFFIPITFVLLLFAAYTFLTVYTKKFRTFGKILSALMTIILSVGIYYVGEASGMFENVAGANTKTDIINVYVLKTDTASSLKDAKDYTFGIMANVDKENTEKTIKNIEEKVGKELAIEGYDKWADLLEDFYNGETEAIIINRAFIDTIVEMEGYSEFESQIKKLHENTIVTEINVDTKKDITNTPFALYISGIDVTGKISTTSRSDVNILVVVNPNTRQILMVNTPRDYYVPLALDGNPMDKLTHAGNYGIDVSMGTLGELYGIDVDYYFRVNFTGFEKVIDALGGIEVYSNSSFTTTHGNYKIVEGMNSLNGKQALGFVRERYSLVGGDNQRGKNQMAVIKAIIDKMTSTALLNDFSGLMESLEGSFQVSMTSAQISSLVRMQLNEGGSWNILNYAVTGDGDYKEVYSMSSIPWVMIPNYETVDKARELIQKVYDGKTLTEADVQ